MNVAGSRYDVGMIGTFEEAREAVRAEIAPLVGGAVLRVHGQGFEDRDAFAVEWGVEYPPLRGISSPLPGALTLVDKMTGFVSITARDAERERIEHMTPVSV